LICSLPLIASAQTDDPARRAAAQALFDSASALMDKHDHAAACPKLEEVARLWPGKIGTIMTLAECYEGAGRVASAWTTYRAAADQATVLGDARAREAQRKADALATKLPRLTIRVAADTLGIPGLEVKRDGVPVGAATWGVTIPIDAGEHVIEAQAPEHAPLRVVVKVLGGEAKEIAVALQRAQPAAVLPVVAPPVTVAPVAPRPPAAAPSSARSPRFTVGLVVGGVGAAGLGAGGILGIVALLKSSSANGSSACKGPTSNLQDVNDCNALRDAARGAQTGAIVAAVTGGVLTGAGAVLVATAPRAAARQAGGVPLTLFLEPTGASLAGRF
jgi:hypothetical protein